VPGDAITLGKRACGIHHLAIDVQSHHPALLTDPFSCQAGDDTWTARNVEHPLAWSRYYSRDHVGSPRGEDGRDQVANVSLHNAPTVRLPRGIHANFLSTSCFAGSGSSHTNPYPARGVMF
jgi:hypothetical protein